MDIKPIKTEADYAAALNEIDRLMDAEQDTPEGDRLDVLTALVAAWEEIYHRVERLKDIEAVRDEDIDYSDIPELDESFWANAELVEPDTSQHVTLRIKKSVLEHFKAKGAKGYQTRITAVLESYVRAQEQKSRDRHRDH